MPVKPDTLYIGRCRKGNAGWKPNQGTDVAFGHTAVDLRVARHSQEWKMETGKPTHLLKCCQRLPPGGFCVSPVPSIFRRAVNVPPLALLLPIPFLPVSVFSVRLALAAEVGTHLRGVPHAREGLREQLGGEGIAAAVRAGGCEGHCPWREKERLDGCVREGGRRNTFLSALLADGLFCAFMPHGEKMKTFVWFGRRWRAV
ncbi:hypothetical protein B0H14DRAFT_3674039 [Mycena olivaceomarginata]|nr:hypothetical protein B0H14DRAFT_3674039 [Mycena olivaceomarginata]